MARAHWPLCQTDFSLENIFTGDKENKQIDNPCQKGTRQDYASTRSRSKTDQTKIRQDEVLIQ